jgi:hypothetical protein
MKNRARFDPRTTGGDTSAIALHRSRLRRLKLRERVWSGDYIKDTSCGFQLWEGPGGFWAGSFAKPVYRLRKAASHRPTPPRLSRRNRTSR